MSEMVPQERWRLREGRWLAAVGVLALMAGVMFVFAKRPPEEVRATFEGPLPERRWVKCAPPASRGMIVPMSLRLHHQYEDEAEFEINYQFAEAALRRSGVALRLSFWDQRNMMIGCQSVIGRDESLGRPRAIVSGAIETRLDYCRAEFGVSLTKEQMSEVSRVELVASRCR